MEIFSMKGKNVIFTGGAGHLGTPLVKTMLEYGARVAVPTRTDKFDESFDEWKKNGQLLFIKADLGTTEGVQKAFAEIYDAFGKIDVLVNGAAFYDGFGAKMCEYRLDILDDETWLRGIDGTLHMVFRCTREIIPYFEKQGHGNIVNFGSMYGVVAPDFAVYGDNIPWNPASYGAGKAGVIQFSKYCASALASKNIRVNSITPGCFPKVGPGFDQEFLKKLSAKAMMNRVGKAEELAGAMLLLASDASSFITGQNIIVDGGATAW